ncbi:SH3 domain-binding protein 1-like [Manduca sexta]|uniref:SH3 domain-binding protein 1-like n=1 Tax=Manduca sexta TaxID=7130 RepID=UPI00188EE600|nr:SH3 domain-binding protein 1-like [Manduca sexta]
MESINLKPNEIFDAFAPRVPTGEAEVGGRKPNDGEAVEKCMGDRPMQPESAAIARLEEERKKWRENSERLEESVKRLEEENSSLRRRLEDLEASNNSRTTTEDMLAMVEARVQARLDEEKIHPGDIQLPVTGGLVGGPQPKTKKEKGKGKKTASAHPTPAPVAGPSSAPLQDIAGPSTAAAGSPAQPATKRKQAKTAPNNKTASGPKPQKGVKKTAPPPPEPRPLPPAPASMEAPWTEVVNRKRTRPARLEPPAPRQPAKRPEPKLRPPKSAAVTISLTPAAIEKGLTYAGVLTNAQQRVDLSGLNIDRLKPKYAATGPCFTRSQEPNRNRRPMP